MKPPTRPATDRIRSTHTSNDWSLGQRVWIRKRPYKIRQALSYWYRPRYLADDCSSRCRRLILRLNQDDVGQQHLSVLRRLPNSDGTPQIVDHQQQAGEHLIVTTWTEGIDLACYFQLVNRQRAVAPSAFESLRLVRGLAHSLLHLHQHHQLVHADIKPQNLILTRKRSFLSLIDFGSAWQQERTTLRQIGDGSQPAFTAPELLNGQLAIDGRVDQFSASVVMYRLLTGVIPYAGLGGRAGCDRFESTVSITLLRPSDRIANARLLPRSLLAAIDEIVLRGLSLNPDKRYATTSAWVHELERLFLEWKQFELGRGSLGRKHPGHWQRWIDWISRPWSIRPSSIRSQA